VNRLEEYTWLISIVTDLKNNYDEHNDGVLLELLHFLKNRIESEEKTVIAKYESNQK